jgi:eukaryotic-like serine/threonine-protein kinase
MSEIKSALSAGEQVAGYQILGMAGAGGMGVVYRALDIRLQRPVALKFLPADLNASEKDKERFLKEARTASSLDHANIGVIHGVEETADGRTFIVMAFYEGESLSQKIRSGPLRVPEAIDIAMQMARGLGEAHTRHIVHRDVKPSNVMLTGQGVAKIVDFGLARVVSSQSMTETGGMTGTVNYMSPEQALGNPVDQRTDMWALGVVFAEMLTGQNPFYRDSVPSVVMAILHEPPRTLEGVPGQLQEIVYRALSKDPQQRYQNCAEILSDLERVKPEFALPTANMDASARTRSIKSGEFKKYLREASKSAWLPASHQRSARLRWWVAAAICMVLVLGGLLAVPFARQRLFGSLFASGENHIVVLPFDNIGNNPANEPLAEGLMDSLAGKLSDLDVGGKSLWVVPSSEVRSRKISDPTAALRELGATMAVKGSIARDGQDVRLTVNLIDTKNMRQVGSASLEDRAGDLATLQDEAVSRLAKLMHINVSADMLKNTGGTVTPAAYEEYLTALGLMQRYDKAGNLDQAISALENSVKTDPRFALGYAQLAEAYRLKYGQDRNLRWLDEAAANGQKAAKLDDHVPAVYVTLAQIHEATGKHDLALQEFGHALQVDPHDASALEGLAATYERMGRIPDAEATFQKAAALRPDFWDGYDVLGRFYDRQGRYPEALAQFKRVLALTPDNSNAYINQAAVYLDMGDPKVFPQAEQSLKKSIELSPSYAGYANLGSLYYNEKRFAESTAMTEKALSLNDQDYMVWSNLIAGYEWLKEDDKASAARERELKLVEALVKVQPQDAVAQSELATLYAEQEARDRALTRIQTALALAPEDPRVLVNVGDAYEALGDRGRALQYVHEALRKGYPAEALQLDAGLQKLVADPNFRPNGKQ